MDVEVAQPLHLRREARRPVVPHRLAKPRPRISGNAVVGMVLWFLLWCGYNTVTGYWLEPDFPSSTTSLIHGVRAFFPMVAAWIALLMILARSSRLHRWIASPLGLILIYAATGLVSSLTLSPETLDATYYAVNYLAIILVLLATVLVDDPLPDLRNILRFTWGVGMVFTLALLGTIPVLGTELIREPELGPAGAQTLRGTGLVMGMATSRNTGLARYAAISALVAIAGLLRKGNRAARVTWGIVLIVSLVALYVANGRTETLGFVLGVMALFGVQRAKRFIFFLVGAAGGLLLGLGSFYTWFYHYFTRTGHFDFTLTGRTRIWEEGFHVLWKSPLIGLGFQADRYYLNWHAHNAFLQALLQSGLLGGIALFVGLAIIWYYIIYHFFVIQPSDKSLIPPEIPAVFLFLTFSSLTESTFAYFSATWLLSVPIIPYVIALHWHMRRSRAMAAREKLVKIRLTRQRFQAAESSDGIEVVPPPPAGGVRY